MEIATFFSLLVWFVPFTYFISLSASENTLPAFGNVFYLLSGFVMHAY
jgi:hypothetical protein